MPLLKNQKGTILISMFLFDVVLVLGILGEKWWFCVRLISISALLVFLAHFLRRLNYPIYWMWAVMAVVAIINGFLFVVPDLSHPDSQGFWDLSRGSVKDTGLILYRPKFYVWFLAVFDNLNTVGWVQLLLRLSLCVALWMAGKIAGWPVSVRILVSALFGLNALWITAQTQILDTTWFATLWFWAFVVFLSATKFYSWVKMLGYGALAGLCTLTRQLADPFLIAGLFVLLFYHRRQWKTVWLGGVIFVLIGWSGAFVNWSKWRIPQRSVALGVNLYTHAHYFSVFGEGQIEFRNEMRQFESEHNLNQNRWNWHYSQNISWFANALPHRYQRFLENTGYSRLQSDRFLAKKYFAWVRKNPGLFFRSWINEMKRLLFKSEEYTPGSLFNPQITKKWLIRWERCIGHWPVWLLLLIPLPLFIQSRFRNLSQGLSYLIPLTYFFMISGIHLGFTRYVLPALPFLYMGIGGVMAYFYTFNFKSILHSGD